MGRISSQARVSSGLSQRPMNLHEQVPKGPKTWIRSVFELRIWQSRLNKSRPFGNLHGLSKEPLWIIVASTLRDM